MIDEQDIEIVTPRVKLDDGREVVFAAQSGGQERFLEAQFIFELLFHGTRGNGKTASLIMAFAQNVGMGYGDAWKGVIFRQSYPQLEDVVAKTHEWFIPAFGDDCTFNKSEYMWRWKTGETLKLAHMEQPKHYDNHHGFGYAFIGWEELTNWPTDELYTKMISTVRVARKGVPMMIRATTNPSGPGHNWVAERFGLQTEWWLDKVVERKDGRLRGAFYGHYRENRALMEASPHYIEGIKEDASDPETALAWTVGSWNIVAGGMFDDVFKPQWNVVRPFGIPNTWRIQRSFDWGGSHPFSIGWWAISDGSDILIDGEWHSTVRGDLFRIREWYGSTGKANEGLDMAAEDIARGIVEREVQWKLRTSRSCVVHPGPADNQIFAKGNTSLNIATDMQNRVRLANNMTYPGINWLRSDKRAGTRIGGWQKMRQYMKNAHPREDGRPREKPGLFVFEKQCPDFQRTILGLARDEKKDRDDIADNQEDHAADEARYMVLHASTGGGANVHVKGGY